VPVWAQPFGALGVSRGPHATAPSGVRRGFDRCVWAGYPMDVDSSYGWRDNIWTEIDQDILMLTVCCWLNIRSDVIVGLTPP
jgi:hypothetical protein